MEFDHRPASAFLAFCLLIAGVGTAWAEEVGVALRVRPRVEGFLTGEPVRAVRENDAIERGLRVELLDPLAALKVGFNFGGCLVVKGSQQQQFRFTGTATLDGKSQVDFGDPNDTSLSAKLRLAVGRLRVALHPEAGCDLGVDTPHVVIRAKGTYFRVLVDLVAGTFVAVDEGSVTVQAKVGETLIGTPVEVTAGNWLLVPPGRLPTRPAPLPPGDDEDDIFLDPPLLGCCDRTEPPKASTPREEPP